MFIGHNMFVFENTHHHFNAIYTYFGEFSDDIYISLKTFHQTGLDSQTFYHFKMIKIMIQCFKGLNQIPDSSKSTKSGAIIIYQDYKCVVNKYRSSSCDMQIRRLQCQHGRTIWPRCCRQCEEMWDLFILRTGRVLSLLEYLCGSLMMAEHTLG